MILYLNDLSKKSRGIKYILHMGTQERIVIKVLKIPTLLIWYLASLGVQC